MKMLLLPVVLAVIGSSSFTVACRQGASKTITQRGNEASFIMRGSLLSVFAVHTRSGKVVTYKFKVSCVIKGVVFIPRSKTISVREYLPSTCGDAYDLLSNANKGDGFLLFTKKSGQSYTFTFDRVNDEDAVFPDSVAAFPCV